MISAWRIVFVKEIREGLRDTRSCASSLAATLGGPLIVFAILSMGPAAGDDPGAHVRNRAMAAIGILPVFLLVSTFVMGMSVAIDTTSGERERRSLEPLLLTGAPPAGIAAGKWAATFALNVAGLLLTLTCAIVILAGTQLGAANIRLPGLGRLAIEVLVAALPLACLASALQLAAATHARTFKEGQTYLSMLLFLPMATGMFLAFSRSRLPEWSAAVPILGQHHLLASVFRGDAPSLLAFVIAGAVALAGSALLVRWTARLLSSGRILYGV